MSAADHLFIPRHELDGLAKHLKAVPDLAIDLQITTTRQDCIGVREGGQPRRDREQPLPFREHGSEAFEVLHSTLATWVRHVLEERGLTFIPIGYTHRHGEFIGPLRASERRLPEGYDENTPAALARWLMANLITLAMTEGCEEAPDEIAHACINARRTVDLPNRKAFQGDCVSCGGDLRAHTIDKFAVCDQCGLVVDKAANDQRITTEVAGRLFTALEMVTIVHGRYGITLKPKKIHDMAYRKTNALEVRGFTPDRQPLYRAGDVFDRLTKVAA